MKGIDCAKPLTAETAVKLAAAGYGFAARYLVPVLYARKRLTRPEAEAITAAGMQIVSVFETTGNRPLGGAKNGYVDGAAAFREAQLIGQPEGSTIYFACDWDATADENDSIAAYLQAAAAQIPGYKVGVYGSFAVIEAMIARAAAQCGWQTYAWSRGKKSAAANLYQYQNGVYVAGIQVDLNESYGGEGWWNTKAEVKSYMLHKADADKIVHILQEAWKLDVRNAGGVALDQDEIHRLANEVRRAGGLPTQ